MTHEERVSAFIRWLNGSGSLRFGIQTTAEVLDMPFPMADTYARNNFCGLVKLMNDAEVEIADVETLIDWLRGSKREHVAVALEQAHALVLLERSGHSPNAIFDLRGVQTGRMSSREPNLQNIPKSHNVKA